MGIAGAVHDFAKSHMARAGIMYTKFANILGGQIAINFWWCAKKKESIRTISVVSVLNLQAGTPHARRYN